MSSIQSIRERMRQALHDIPASDRETWVRMAMSIKSELGDDGFEIWDEWSQQDDSHDPKSARDVWKSISANGKVGAGTLFHTAKVNGWSGDGAYFSPEEQAKRQQKADSRIDQGKAEIASARAKTGGLADKILKAATKAQSDHSYLVQKRVSPPSTLREIHAAEAAEILNYVPSASGIPLVDRLLVIPVTVDDKLSTLELIDGDGRKAALAGRGTKAGGYWAAQSLPTDDGDGLVLLIGEGVATVLSAQEATGHPAIACFSNTNMKQVAEVIHERYPAAQIVVLADVVKATGEPDRYAIEAARSVRGKLAIPTFGDNRPDGATDFNDMAGLQGTEAVARVIAGASLPTVTVYRPGIEPATARDLDRCPKPLPLPKLPLVPEFPLEILPDDFTPWIGDAADRARFPPDFAGVAIMAALGSVIGRKLGIRLKQRDDWTEYGNVWAELIGSPSTLKSPAMRAAMRPFKALQVSSDAQHETEMGEYAAQLEEFKLRKAARKKAAVKALAESADATIDIGGIIPPIEPVARTYWTSDATGARLGELLAENPNGLLVERDELSSLLMTLEDERNADARGLYLSGWSGSEGYRFDRIGRGTTALPKFALSVCGGIQPGPLSRYVRSAYTGERADGLLQRFQLAVWPDAQPFEYVDRFPDGPARKAAAELFKHADTFDPGSIGTCDNVTDAPPFLHFSNQAQEVFVAWYSEFMRNRRAVETGGGESAPIAAHFGKYSGLVGKLCLILHVADDPKAKEVSRRTLLKALAWIEYLTPHARRIYHAVEHPETGAAELLLARLKRGELPVSFKAWEITRKGWHGLTDREAVKKACRLLFEYQWLIEREPGGKQGIGRPAAPTYAISSAVELPA